MEKKASLNIAYQSKIVTLRGEGYLQKKISEKCCVSLKAVQTAVKTFKLNGSFTDRKRSGPPKKLSLEMTTG